jgi:hypothetical protein
MGKSESYRAVLKEMEEWEPFLLRESRLPGPRANLELAQAAAEEGSREQFFRFLALDAEAAPTGTAREFLPVCGAIGLGRLLAEGDRSVLPAVRACANDPRWRLREGAVMALQRWGDTDLQALLDEMERWPGGSLLERRAAAAALCEPRLLREPGPVLRVLAILDRITTSLLAETDRKGADFIALRKGLGYCWSVAAATLPDQGKLALEKWIGHPDPDIRWIMKENLMKDRLKRLDSGWVEAVRHRIADQG